MKRLTKKPQELQGALAEVIKDTVDAVVASSFARKHSQDELTVSLVARVTARCTAEYTLAEAVLSAEPTKLIAEEAAAAAGAGK